MAKAYRCKQCSLNRLVWPTLPRQPRRQRLRSGEPDDVRVASAVRVSRTADKPHRVCSAAVK